jgi:hypothetical protein
VGSAPQSPVLQTVLEIQHRVCGMTMKIKSWKTLCKDETVLMIAHRVLQFWISEKARRADIIITYESSKSETPKEWHYIIIAQ